MHVKKMFVKEIIKLYGDQVSCLAPAALEDYDAFKQLPFDTEMSAKITKARKYSTHKYGFKMIQFAIDNGINDKDCIIEGCEFVLKKEVIHAKYLENSCDWVYTWRDILQTLFLPKVERTNIDGTKEKVRGSIEYAQRDELAMKIYLNKVAEFFSLNLGMTVIEFKLASGG